MNPCGSPVIKKLSPQPTICHDETILLTRMAGSFLSIELEHNMAPICVCLSLLVLTRVRLSDSGSWEHGPF